MRLWVNIISDGQYLRGQLITGKRQLLFMSYDHSLSLFTKKSHDDDWQKDDQQMQVNWRREEDRESVAVMVLQTKLLKEITRSK